MTERQRDTDRGTRRRTPEKFAARRLALAETVWRTMEQTDSRECRNCHSFEFMAGQRQSARARALHADAQRRRRTCIECHKGIVHQLPAAFLDREHERFERERVDCSDCHEGLKNTYPDDEEWASWGFDE